MRQVRGRARITHGHSERGLQLRESARRQAAGPCSEVEQHAPLLQVEFPDKLPEPVVDLGASSVVAVLAPLVRVEVRNSGDEDRELPWAHLAPPHGLEGQHVPEALQQALDLTPDAAAEVILAEQLHVLGLVALGHSYRGSPGLQVLRRLAQLCRCRDEGEGLAEGSDCLIQATILQHLLHAATVELRIQLPHVIHAHRHTQQVLAQDEAERKRQGVLVKDGESHEATQRQELAVLLLLLCWHVAMILPDGARQQRLVGRCGEQASSPHLVGVLSQSPPNGIEPIAGEAAGIKALLTFEGHGDARRQELRDQAIEEDAPGFLQEPLPPHREAQMPGQGGGARGLVEQPLPPVVDERLALTAEASSERLLFVDPSGPSDGGVATVAKVATDAPPQATEALLELSTEGVGQCKPESLLHPLPGVPLLQACTGGDVEAAAPGPQHHHTSDPLLD
mmetsp:Transcript_87992/g.188774  ORF Transcript_87992/g.188774 Transcript_87992/m.188774 type:complete len:451 (-) Transcript_87992:319-1671(-)